MGGSSHTLVVKPHEYDSGSECNKEAEGINSNQAQSADNFTLRTREEERIKE